MSISDQVRTNLLTIVRAYRRATGKPQSAVSKQIYGNSAFLREFQYGRQSISLDKLDDVLDDLRGRWPAGEPWPGTPAIVMEQHPPEKNNRGNRGK